MSVPGLCAKYGYNRMVTVGALAPAFANAALFFSQTSNNHPLISILSTGFGFVAGGVIGMASFNTTMAAHDKMDELLSGRSMSMTRKVKLVRRGQVAVFSLAAWTGGCIFSCGDEYGWWIERYGLCHTPRSII